MLHQGWHGGGNRGMFAIRPVLEEIGDPHNTVQCQGKRKGQFNEEPSPNMFVYLFTATCFLVAAFVAANAKVILAAVAFFVVALVFFGCAFLSTSRSKSKGRRSHIAEPLRRKKYPQPWGTGSNVLLSPAEENELGHCIQTMNKLKNLPQDELNQEQCTQLLKGKSARDKMIQSNLRIVWNLSKRYQNKSAYDQYPSMDALVQEGIIGLEKAVDNYDPDRAIGFSSSAYWVIRQQMEKFIEIKTGITEQDRQLKEKKYESLKDKNTMELDELVQKYPSALTSKEKTMVSLRFGFDQKYEWRTFAEVARHLNCSRAHAREVVGQSLRKLRKTKNQASITGDC